MKIRQNSPITLIVAMAGAAGLGMISPACGADSMSTAPPGSFGVDSTVGGSNSATGGAGAVTSTSVLGAGGVTGAGGSSNIIVAGSASQGGAQVSSTGGAISVCTSKTMWTNGQNSSMRPGEACITCHATTSEAPVYVIAGTVYPTAHEPADCNGSNTNANGGPATVIISDAQDVVKYTIPVNSVGNFMLAGVTIPSPYKASVKVGTATRSMATPQTNGDCNSCHTMTGLNGAPGRIMLP